MFSKASQYEVDFLNWEQKGRHIETRPNGINYEDLQAVHLRGETTYKRNTDRAKSAMR